MEVYSGIISKKSITVDVHGFLQVYLSIWYAGGSKPFGNLVWYTPKDNSEFRMLSTAGYFIHKCLEVSGVVNWEDLLDQRIRVRVEKGFIRAIGHSTKEQWFCPSEDFKQVTEH